MTNKELKHLSRAELLEMLIERTNEVERLSKELDETKRLLNDKKITIENAGSIAEAALALSGVFDRAQAAADLYLSNIKGTTDEEEN